MNENAKQKKVESMIIITTLMFIVVSPFAVVAAVHAVNQYGVFLALPFIVIAIICFVGLFMGIYLNIKLLRK